MAAAWKSRPCALSCSWPNRPTGLLGRPRDSPRLRHALPGTGQSPRRGRTRRMTRRRTSRPRPRSCPMNESPLLRDASVQDIQLELLRRTSFNALDGERVCASLLKHRDLWRAALLDRPGVANYAEPGLLLMGGLIKLRDLADSIWNADTLFILTPT